MARILVSYFKVQEVSIGKPLCFWDGFVKELAALGNDVYLINTGYFNTYTSNEVRNKQLDHLLLEKAKAFDPELIITFNHRIPKSFLDEFDVPIIIWDGDELTYFCDHDYMRNNIDRYKVFSISKSWLQDYRDFGFANNQIFYVPQATATRKMDIEQTMNVSFLGARHFQNNRHAKLIKTHQYSNRFYSLVEEFLNTHNYDYAELFRKAFWKDYPELKMELRDLYPLFDFRWLDLANMLDLGLTIAGHESRWEDVAEFMPQISAAYNPMQVWSLEETNYFYNSSKVSMCPITPQARGAAFAWRVFDIMASNACLLVSESSDLRELTKDYLDMPMYQTPWEARELCIKMLKDDNYRLQIVAASQKYVDENARWIHRFRNMEQIIGNINIVNESAVPGHVYDMVLDDQETQKALKAKSTLISTGASTSKQTYYQKVKPKLKDICLKATKVSSVLMSFGLSILILILGMELLSARTGSIIGKIVIALGIVAFAFSVVLAMLKAAIIFHRSQWGEGWLMRRAHLKKYKAFQAKYPAKIEAIRQVYQETGKIKVLFIVIFSSVFPSEPVFEKMRKDSVFDPYILVTADMSRTETFRNDSYAQSFRELYEKYGERVISGYDERTGSCKEITEEYQIIFHNNPYFRMCHKFHYIFNFLECNTLHMYVNYGFAAVKFGRVIMGMDFYNYLWKACIDSNLNLMDLKKYEPLRGKNGLVTGYVKMDRMADAPLYSRIRKCIIICPHHTVTTSTPLDLSNFLKYADFFIELPKRFPTIDFVFRPHPLLFTNLTSENIWNQRMVDDYLKRMLEAPNIKYDHSGDYFELFKNSDGMIHDCSSFIGEYLFTEKPCCYMLKSEKEIKDIMNPMGVECMKQYYHAFSEQDIINFIDQVIIGENDPLKESREKFSREQLKFNYPKATDTVIKVIKDTLC